MNTLGIDALDSLINQLSRLPGIGRKTAQRLALFILKSDAAYSEALAEAIVRLKKETRFCSRCFNINHTILSPFIPSNPNRIHR